MERLILFAKRPRHGQVKTRLAPALGHDAALALYAAFLADSVRLVLSLPDRPALELCLDGPWTPDLGPVPHPGLTLTEQAPGDLGQRLLRAFDRSHRGGAARTVLIGSDSPTLPPDRLSAAFGALRGGADLVVAPAEDGGYVLIGMRAPLPELFGEVPWGQAGVMEATRRRAADLGLAIAELPGLYDVDDPAGLERLREELADPEVARRACDTARVLTQLDGPYRTVL